MKIKQKIIIDCDPGHDDAMAIIMALANRDKINILGITTVVGNQTIEKVTQNAINIISFFNHQDIPVYMGEETPLKITARLAGKFHGESGMDGPVFQKYKYQLSKENAINWLKKTLLNSTTKIIILAIGPLTNIAKLINKYPKCKEKIEKIVFMGGSIIGGNITATSEFNIWHDPHAADIIFKSGLDLFMIGLGATNQAILPWKHIDNFKKQNTSTYKMVYDLMEFYGIIGKKVNSYGAELHDALAMFALLHQNAIKYEKKFIDVEITKTKTEGQTFIDDRKLDVKIPNIYLAKSIDSKLFLKEMLNSIRLLDEEKEKKH